MYADTLQAQCTCIESVNPTHPAQTVYEEMEVDAEMQRGLLPGLLALSVKLWPAVQTVARRTAAFSGKR